jgi:predicted dehydrogenase
MSDHVSRRDFIRAALAAGTAIPAIGWDRPRRAVAAERKSAGEKLNLAIIGVAAKGEDNLNNVASENIAVLCDIDAARLGKAAERFPAAKCYDDYRRVFDHNDLDGVVISTPDHMHAIPTALALRRGLAVYCEKPLTHTVFEARTIRELTAKHKNVTQMGTQIHAGDNYRRAVEIVQAGVIGPVKRVLVWQNAIVPPCQRVAQGEVPPGINYDAWLGPAPYRPFHLSHFHFKWRWWWDFGGGVLADMACHYTDLPFWALGLTAPTSVVCTRAELGDDEIDKAGNRLKRENEPPTRMQVDYQYPGRGSQPAVHLTWYHGGWKPEGAESYGLNSAVLFEGSDGRLLADYGSRKLFMQEGKEARSVEPSIPNSIGHWKEWINAVKTNSPTTCNFEYAGALTEAVLLGNVSHRAGNKTLQWDSEKLQVTNEPSANQYLHTEYRQGWVL